MITRDQAEEVLARHALQRGGAPLDRAAGVIVALHGRGGDAAGMLDLGQALARPDLAVLAPQAEGRSWYPQRFIVPLQDNQPWLDTALAQVAGVLEALAAAGVPDGRVVLMGFSQGACLALETAIRRPRAYGGVLGFAGGYIGPEGQPRAPQGRLDGVPVLLACAEHDAHIPAPRVRETAELMTAMGARVDLRLRPGAQHGIDDDGVARARAVLLSLAD
jgi:phospholipase/carboxylesterase